MNYWTQLFFFMTSTQRYLNALQTLNKRCVVCLASRSLDGIWVKINIHFTYHRYLNLAWNNLRKPFRDLKIKIREVDTQPYWSVFVRIFCFVLIFFDMRLPPASLQNMKLDRLLIPFMVFFPFKEKRISLNLWTFIQKQFFFNDNSVWMSTLYTRI